MTPNTFSLTKYTLLRSICLSLLLGCLAFPSHADAGTSVYETHFEELQGYSLGSLDGQDGWSVLSGEAEVVDLAGASGGRAAALLPGAPSSEISRQFPGLSSEGTVFVSFRLTGPAAGSPGEGPRVFSPDTLAVSWVEEGDVARLYAFDGDGSGNGAWAPVPAILSLDAAGSIAGWPLVTIRADYSRKTFDLYIEDNLVGFDYGFIHDEQENFTELRWLGNSSGSIYLGQLYFGGTNPLFDNQSGDGIPDAWKILYALDLDRDIRDEDPDGDGLTNLEEFLLGANPRAADTSRDGLSDSQALDLEVDFLSASNIFPVALPFFDGFEFWPLGEIHARGGWIVSGDGLADVVASPRFRGERALLLDAEDGLVAVRVGVSENEETIIWTDFYVQPSAHIQELPPQLSAGTAVGLYFDSEGRAVAWDGLSHSWRAFAPDADTEKAGWTRVTIRQDFTAQTWSLWLNAVRVAEDLGFASHQESFTRFRLVQPDASSTVDEVLIAIHEPALLDNDGDGLTNEQERLIGSNPDSVDTSDDGMWDGEKVIWGFDPAEWDDFGRWFEDEEGKPAWATGFESDEGYLIGALHGQQGWIASVGAEISAEGVYAGEQGVRIASVNSESQPHQIERFMGFGDEKQVWVTMHVQGQSGLLPRLSDLEGHHSTLVAFNHEGFLHAYDGEKKRWRNTHQRFDDEEWVRLDILMDYTESRWLLCVNRVLVFKDFGFRDTGLRTLTRIGVRGASRPTSGSTGVDNLRAGFDEPANLDFSGDGMTNDEKRALGLDIFLTDTSGDGIPDWWLVQHGLDARDATVGGQDLSGDGLTVLQNYLLGTDPTQWDTDGDGWSDFQEYLAGTDLHDPASAPVADGMQEWVVARVGQGLEPYSFRVGEEYRLLGSGVGLGVHEDGFTFVYQEISGNFEAIACIPGPEHLALGPEERPEWMAINGLMARATLESDSPYSAVSSGTYLMHGPAESYWSHFREVPGARSVPLAHGPSDDPKYVRMRRVNNRFRHYLSHDGEAWALVAEVAVQMPEAILLGMFTSSDSTDSYVRGRVREIEIRGLSDQSDWNWNDTDGGVNFDSFAWMGEWSGGVDDFDSAALVLRQPALEELHEAGFETAIAVVIDGADAVDTLGEWEVHDKSIVCRDRRGWVEFDLEVDGQDVFLLELEAREHNSNRVSLATFDLKFYIGEEYLGTRTLEATSKDSGTVYVFTPWLQPGTHRLRVQWDGARQWSYLGINAVRLLTIDQAGADEEGVKRWVKDRISRQSGTFPQPPLLTHVSPLQVEGRDRFNSLMRVGNQALIQGGPGMHRQFFRPFADHPRGGVGRDYRPFREDFPAGEAPVFASRETHLIPNHPVQWGNYLKPWGAPTGLKVKRGAGYRFWADVPLAPLVDNAITLQWQDGVAEERRVVRWIPFNVLTGGSMVLRAGDSVMLTAHSGKQQSGQVLISINHESFETIPASPIVHTFSEPGEYLIEGTYLHPNGHEFSGTLEVSVQGFTFGDPPVAYVNRRRSWQPFQEDESNLLLEGDPRLHLTPVNERAVTLLSPDNDRKVVTARTSDGGAILDAIEVEGFRLFSSWETTMRVVEILPDETKVVEMTVILSPVLDDVEVRLQIFVGGVLFDDGTLERVLTAADFDELGQTVVRFFKETSVTTASCHRVRVFQNDTLIGQR